jgi:hypothetical protein
MSSKKAEGKREAPGAKGNDNAKADSGKDAGSTPAVAIEFAISGGIHPASSEKWGASATARLMQIIMETNLAMDAQIVENETYFLDSYTTKQLEDKDDLGLNLVFVAIYHDRPDMLRYLYSRGVNIMAPCDPIEFGSPMFYAVIFQKYRIVDTLEMLGCPVKAPCDILNQTPHDHARRLDDPIMLELLDKIKDRTLRANNILEKNVLRKYWRDKFLLWRKSIIVIQRVCRGVIGRRKAKKRKEQVEAAAKRERMLLAGLITDEDDAEEAGPAAQPVPAAASASPPLKASASDKQKAGSASKGKTKSSSKTKSK